MRRWTPEMISAITFAASLLAAACGVSALEIRC
jgi:hypothetical protein